MKMSATVVPACSQPCVWMCAGLLTYKLWHLAGAVRRARLPHPSRRRALPRADAQLPHLDVVTGWRLDVGGRSFDMLSPVRGEVVEVNREALSAPALASEEPYGRGWLLKVRWARPGVAVKNLLSGRLARVWTEQATERLSGMMGGELGAVLHVCVAGEHRDDPGVRLSGLVESRHGTGLAAQV